METHQSGVSQRRILLAAARVLADDPAASMQQVADEAQVARPTVYRCYPSTAALVEAIGHEAAGISPRPSATHRPPATARPRSWRA